LTLDNGEVATRYNWNGEVSSTTFFGTMGTTIKIIAAIWNGEDSTIICAGYAQANVSSQVVDLIKSVQESEA